MADRHTTTDPPGGRRERPWEIAHAKGRVAPRECIRAARDALDRAYGRTSADELLYPFMIEALDWLRRGLEQMADADA